MKHILMRKPMFLYMGLLFCVICWGSNFIFGAILVNYFRPMEIAFIRLLFINLFLFIILFKVVASHQPLKRAVIFLMMIGFIGVTLNHWSFYASLTKADPVTAALILATAPIFTAFINYLLFKEAKNIFFWAWSMLSFAGVTLVIMKKNSIEIGAGEGYIFLTMLSFSVFMVMVERYANSFSSGIITFYSSFFGMVFMTAALPFSDVSLTRTAPAGMWLLLIVTGIIMHGICPLIWNHCISRVGSTNASLLLNMEPFIAMMAGYLILKETVSSIQFIGSLLIITGVAMAIQSNKRNALVAGDGMSKEFLSNLGKKRDKPLKL
ncbi:DMT family transporter [Metabacillus idriensis]|uniref:DMT family transporter n=1 Tax=Metabacillus idriensis TaxID=324768 RepID=UPI0028146719|nr:DMT family transporter [Metabacillus idriensis]MDR0139363.1 DMT family transporter [Metabacillus idriensis]